MAVNDLTVGSNGRQRPYPAATAGSGVAPLSLAVIRGYIRDFLAGDLWESRVPPLSHAAAVQPVAAPLNGRGGAVSPAGRVGTVSGEQESFSDGTADTAANADVQPVSCK